MTKTTLQKIQTFKNNCLPMEANIRHHTPSLVLEPAEEEKKAALLEAEHEGRIEGAGHDLARRYKSSPKQCSLEDCR